MKRVPITCALLCCVFLPALAEMAPQPQPYLIGGSSNNWAVVISIISKCIHKNK